MNKRLLDAIIGTRDLARNNPDIKSIVSFGSSNRQYADDNSDLDLFIFTTDRARYLNKTNDGWLADSYGQVLSRVVVEELMDKILFNRVLLENMFSLDIIVVDINEFASAKYFLWLKKRKLSSIFSNKFFTKVDDKLYTFHYYLKRGYDILYDDVNINKIIKSTFEVYKPDPYLERNNQINQDAFEKNYSQFWQSCNLMISSLRDGDYFHALNFHDHEVKKSIIQMVHWYTLLNSRNKELDVYYKGAKIYEWCEESLIEQLYKIFPHQDFAHIFVAIDNSISVYQQLSHLIGERYGFTINLNLENQIFTLMQKEMLRALENDLDQRSQADLIKKDLTLHKSEECCLMFLSNYNQFWQYCYKMMGKLIRRDFYYAIFILDNNIKRRLSEMVEWFNALKSKSEETSDRQINIAKLLTAGIYPHSNIEDMKSSIRNTIKVYKTISHDIAKTLHIPINSKLEVAIEKFIVENIAVSNNI